MLEGFDTLNEPVLFLPSPWQETFLCISLFVLTRACLIIDSIQNEALKQIFSLCLHRLPYYPAVWRVYNATTGFFIRRMLPKFLNSAVGAGGSWGSPLILEYLKCTLKK